MLSIPQEEGLFNNIDIGCCDNSGSQHAATLGSMREINCISKTEEKVAVVAPSRQARKARLSGKVSSSLLYAPKKYLKASFTKSRSGDNEKNGNRDNDDKKSSQDPQRSSIAGCLSTANAAQLVAEEYFQEGPHPDLLTMNSLLDDSCDDANLQEKDGHVADLKSLHSVPSHEDAIALEVGLNAHEYLEECFYTEVSILDRGKFNAVPEVAKSDFTIKGHLGKGTFSDVFDVVCTGGQIFDKKMTNTVSGGIQLNRRRSSRAMRSNPLSSSINVASLARPAPRSDSRLVFAMKCLRPQIRSDADQFTIGSEDLVHETALLANLNHRHIIKVHGRASGHLTDAFRLNDGFFILLDKLGDTLNDRIEKWKKSKATRNGHAVKQLEVAHDISLAVEYLHSKNIVFRDLKPDNVGFDCSGVLKLFDFGFATGLPEKDEGNPAGFLFDRCGTPRYMAPEVGLSLGYGLSSDVYSFGILLWELGSLVKPFMSATSSSEFEKAVFMGGERPVMDISWSENVKKLINSCWSASPNKRPTMLDIKSSLSIEILSAPSEEETQKKSALFKVNRRTSDNMY